VRIVAELPRRLAGFDQEPRTADVSFDALGTTVRVVVEAPDADDLTTRARRIVEDYDRRLSRFREDSELCALNADPRETVPASPLLRDAVRAALWAARRSNGLVDPTLLPQLERAGYAGSMRPVSEPRIPRGAKRAARPHPDAAWQQIRVGPDRISRPPGLRLDLGGTGKGHVADLVARILTRTRSWAIDCGGDVRVGGVVEQPILVAHPSGGDAARFSLSRAAVATSAVHARAWPGGHHLLDPATGEPVWTGVVQATAIATRTIEAETLAKMAVLSGPDVARDLLAAEGGVIVLEDGEVVTVP
jgi:thiamine biosynthesis lipoprotein